MDSVKGVWRENMTIKLRSGDRVRQGRDYTVRVRKEDVAHTRSSGLLFLHSWGLAV